MSIETYELFGLDPKECFFSLKQPGTGVTTIHGSKIETNFFLNIFLFLVKNDCISGSLTEIEQPLKYI